MVTLTLGGTAGSSDYTVNTALGSITIPANATSATGTLELTPTDGRDCGGRRDDHHLRDDDRRGAGA